MRSVSCCTMDSVAACVRRVCGCLSSSELRVVVVGLQNSGKTALVQALRTVAAAAPAGGGEHQGLLLAPLSLDGMAVASTTPTVQPTHSTIRVGLVVLAVTDLGGQERFVSSWRQHLESPRTDLVVFVVDVSDLRTVGDARARFHEVLAAADARGTLVLVVGTKTDLVHASAPPSRAGSRGVDLPQVAISKSPLMLDAETLAAAGSALSAGTPPPGDHLGNVRRVGVDALKLRLHHFLAAYLGLVHRHGTVYLTGDNGEAETPLHHDVGVFSGLLASRDYVQEVVQWIVGSS